MCMLHSGELWDLKVQYVMLDVVRYRKKRYCDLKYCDTGLGALRVAFLFGLEFSAASVLFL